MAGRLLKKAKKLRLTRKNTIARARKAVILRRARRIRLVKKRRK